MIMCSRSKQCDCHILYHVTMYWNTLLQRKWWWSAYLPFNGRVDQKKVFEVMEAIVAHVHIFYVHWPQYRSGRPGNRRTKFVAYN